MHQGSYLPQHVANFVSVPVFVFALQRDGELLLMLSTLLPQLQLVTDNAFLQPTLLHWLLVGFAGSRC